MKSSLISAIIQQVRSRWLRMLVIWLTIAGVGAAYALLTASTYRSEGKLFVRLGRENVTLDPTANLGEGSLSAVPLTREAEMNTIAETLRSRGVIDRVVAKLSAEAVLNDQQRWLDAVLPNSLPPEELAAMKLSKMLKSGVLRKSNVLSVSCDAHDPQFAQTAATAFINSYLDYHRELSRVAGAKSFFDEQATRLSEQVKANERELAAVKDEAQITSLVEQKRSLLAHVDELTQDVARTEAEMAEASAAIRTLEQQLRTAPERIVAESSTGHGNQAADSMRDQLYTLQIRESELSAKFTGEHHAVRQVRDQLAKATAALAGEQRVRTHTTEARSRAYEQAELALGEKQALLAGLEARLAVRRPQHAKRAAELLGLNQVEIKLDRLERELALSETAYKKYAQSLEQTRMDESLERDRISNIAVAEWPATSHKSIKPNRPVLLCVSMLLATLAALVAGVGSRTISERVVEYYEDRMPHDRSLDTTSLLPTSVNGTASLC